MTRRLLTFILSTLTAASLFAGENLLVNGDFETAAAGAITGCSWPGWAFTCYNDPVTATNAPTTAIETTDKVSGAQAIRFSATPKFGKIEQDVDLSSYEVGQEFILTVHYKIVNSTATYAPRMGCVWTYPMMDYYEHEDKVLRQELLRSSSEWQTLEIHTTKPEGGTILTVGLDFSKGDLFLLDGWSLEVKADSKAPWMEVNYSTEKNVSININDTAKVAEITIKQANCTQPVSVSLVGNAEQTKMFSIDKSSVTDEEETVVVSYCPTAVGKHSATVVVENAEIALYNETFTVHGEAFDTTRVPVITITPTSLPHFTCTEGETVSDTILVSATDCADYVNIVIENTEEIGAFIINNSQMPANVQDGLCIVTFQPMAAGEYSATIRFSTTGGETQTLSVSGTAEEKIVDPEQKLPYDTVFTFDNCHPQAVVINRFDTVGHNTELNMEGWQNVVLAGNRGWWGLDKANDEEFYSAKATAYVTGATDDTPWEMWLVTPALDYKNAVNQVFTFRVRGDYLQDEMLTKLELYYIDATDPEDIYQQALEVSIPAKADDAGEWRDIHVNLTGQETIADVFYMAFRFAGPSGANGAATYYVDDITWGNPELPVISTDSVQAYFVAEQGQAGGTVITITGEHLSEGIQAKLVGDNAGSFVLSNSSATSVGTEITLPAEGDKLIIALQQNIEGLYVAYLQLSSRGAATVTIPVACLVTKAEMGIEQSGIHVQPVKQLINGSIRILRGDKTYGILGQEL